MTDRAPWPDIHVAEWAPTKKNLHLYAQMLGKIRVALSPTQPNWMFTALLLNSRGFTTGPIPWQGASVQGSLDVFSSEIIVERSNGEIRRIPLVPPRTVAEVYRDLTTSLRELAVDCPISPLPQELPDVTPMDEDRRHAAYDPEAVRRWFSVATLAAGIFENWREHFFGRTAIQLWWGALDVSLILFSGKHVPPPADRGFLMKYDLDAEMMAAGLYYGDEQNAPFFYGYIFPQPPHVENMPIHPAAASWSDAVKEWVLPYDAVRGSAEPEAEVRTFLDAIYAQCVAAGWDLESLSYAAPPRRARSAEHA